MNARNAIRTIVLFAPLLMVLALAGPGWAQEEEVAKPEVRDRFGFTVGDYFFGVSSSIEWALPDAPGDKVDWEDGLGMDANKSTFRFDGHWRFNNKHRIDFQLFRFSRQGETTLEEEFTWGGVTYVVGADIDARVTISYLQAMYGYSFVNNDKWEFGFAGGLSALQFKTKIAGEAWVDETQQEFTRESKSLTAPVPVLGPYLEWRFARNWHFDTHAYIFDANYDKYSATFYDLMMGVRWYPTKVVGLGVNFNYEKWKVSAEDQGEVIADYKIDGWHAFLAFRF